MLANQCHVFSPGGGLAHHPPASAGLRLLGLYAPRVDDTYRPPLYLVSTYLGRKSGRMAAIVALTLTTRLTFTILPSCFPMLPRDASPRLGATLRGQLQVVSATNYYLVPRELLIITTFN